MTQKKYIRLPLKNAYNVRDLGGHACSNGRCTRWNTLLRADDLNNLEDSEIDFLIEYGVKCVIDLRSTEECELHPDPFAKDSRVKYINIALMTNVMTDITVEILEKANFSLGKTYIDMANNAQEKIRNVFQIIAESDGGVLFHCAAGKDRTGIIAMLLMGAVGVSMPDMVFNYEITHTCIKQNPDFTKSLKGYPIEASFSKPEYIENLIFYILDKYISIPQYLKTIGVTYEMMEKIQNKFCE